MNTGTALPLPLTVIASPAVPQENLIVPEEVGSTRVMFAVRLVDSVPQFATRTCGLPCVDSDAKAMGSKASAKSMVPTTE